jgi:hypothetical protein
MHFIDGGDIRQIQCGSGAWPARVYVVAMRLDPPDPCPPAGWLYDDRLAAAERAADERPCHDGPRSGQREDAIDW